MRMHAIAAALALTAVAALAQAPRIIHANVVHAAASSDLGAQIRASQTAWIGYAVPAVDRYRVSCGGVCRLSDDDNMSFSGRDDDDLRPAAGELAIFYRLANGAITNVRAWTTDCTLDASGASVSWIDGVDPRRSVALLASLVGGEKKLSRRAISTVALHAEPSAADLLERWTRSGSEDEVRGDAVFWLATTRPERGLEAARALLRDASASRKLREKAIFALSLIKTPAATDELIRTARSDDDAHTRGQALFWLSQQAGKKAAGAIRDAVDGDADAKVRERAVFAISQLPNDEGIPILVDLLKHHRDANVRRKAAFWLGQKNDPRALQALEDILKN